MLKKIYILGNPLLEFDSLPIRLKPKLEMEFPEISFEVIDPNENLHPNDGFLAIIDTVINIKEPAIIDNIEDLELSPRYSMHDLDLAFTLKLLVKIGKLKKVWIIGIPPIYDEVSALRKACAFINKIKDSA
jgi:Ni,Fe-hydrogenase maturation factor